jgi:hypothetical protein
LKISLCGTDILFTALFLRSDVVGISAIDKSFLRLHEQTVRGFDPKNKDVLWINHNR